MPKRKRWRLLKNHERIRATDRFTYNFGKAKLDRLRHAGTWCEVAGMMDGARVIGGTTRPGRTRASIRRNWSAAKNAGRGYQIAREAGT